MESKLIKFRDILNEDMKKINKGIKTIDEITLLPLLQHLTNSKSVRNEEIKNLFNSKSIQIKKLKFYEFNDFNKVSDKIENNLSEFTDEIQKILPKDSDRQSIDFLLYEILINIYKHSKFENAYVKINNYNNNHLGICIIDDGIGIHGSFKESSIYYKNDCEAIFEAINGKTTDKEKFNLHGRGLNSSTRITTLGFEGEMLIASGNGICIITKKGVKTQSNYNAIKGTYIIMNINQKKIENIYEYLRYERINKIKEEKNDK